MTPAEARDLAASWAKGGIPAFPVALKWNEGKGSVDKRPLTKNGHLDATVDLDRLKELFRTAKLRSGERWGVGLWWGGAGYLVLDVDVKGGGTGVEDLAALQSDGLDVAAYTSVDTASGGQHLIGLKPNGSEEVGNLHVAPGIEIRADKGWTVAPGTSSPWGKWSRDPGTPPLAKTATWPQWVIERGNRRRTEPIPDVVTEGDRHGTLLRIAGALRRQGADAPTILAALRQFNADHCRPPKEDRLLEEMASDLVERYQPVPSPPPDRPDNRTTTKKPRADAESESGSAKRTGRTTPGVLPQLATEPDLLAEFAKRVKKAGLAGEEVGAQLLYLAFTSRALPWGPPGNRPVSVLPRGTSGSGKSYLVEAVLRFIPDVGYINLGSMSRRYLMYSEETLEHKFIVVPELASVADDDELMATLRVLLSEGRLIHGTVEGEGKRRARRIEKTGPTGLVVTTAAAYVDPELETRMLSLITDDTPEQTRRVFEALAALETSGGPGVDFEPWLDLQLWLNDEAETRVVIPYIESLARLMPTVATRLRRDFVSLLSLIRAHALLHQETRKRDEAGRVVADITDYGKVAKLISDIVAESVEAVAGKAIRDTVEAVAMLTKLIGREYTSVKAVSGELDVGRSATYDRVKRALSRGWLVNLAGKDERGYKLAVGAELPAEGTGFLPTPEDVLTESCPGRPDGVPDNENRPPPGVSAELSGRPARPEGYRDETDELPDPSDFFDFPDEDEWRSATTDEDLEAPF